MRKIGILGGTFNPIHFGHLMLAEWAADALSLEQVWVMPTGFSYCKAKQSMPDGEERLKMVRLAVEDNPRLCCKDTEVRRKGATYTYETMEQLKEQLPDTEFYFITGADCLFALEEWKHPERLLACCTLVAAVRDGSSMRQMEQKSAELAGRFGGSILVLPFARLSVTSTMIRERIAGGQSVRYMVPERTLEYIMEKGFYRDEK